MDNTNSNYAQSNKGKHLLNSYSSKKNHWEYDTGNLIPEIAHLSKVMCN